VIEDVAHAFGARYQNQDVGTFGDAAMFSFGRDKAISSTAGGMAIAKNPEVAKRLRAIADASPFPSLLTIKQNLLHPLLIPWCSKRMGKRRLGSAVLRIAQALRLVNRVYTSAELDSKPPSILTRRMPNAMASLAWQQLQDHHELFLAHRKKLAMIYTQWASDHTISTQVAPEHAQPSWLRFTVFVQHPQTLIATARSHGYQLGDWYTAVIMPKPHDVYLLGYRAGSCPNAEQAAHTSVNLPTHIHMTQAGAASLTALLSSQV
jgi:dTDP-4-amino-4,6-dideoxygalactose transaminase